MLKMGHSSLTLLMTTIPLLVLLLLAALAAQSRLVPRTSSQDSHENGDMIVPGWMGSNYSLQDDTEYYYQVVQPDSIECRTQQMQVLDADARIFLFRGFLSPEECDHIISLAQPHLTRSHVVVEHNASVTHEVHDARTSQGMFLTKRQDPIVQAVEDRIAAWTLMPVSHQEDLQVLRYQDGQKYEPHHDFFDDEEGMENNRYATVLMYLNDVEEGGETVFPLIPAPDDLDSSRLSECARNHLAVKPRKGDAVLFHSIAPDGSFEERSLHGACPVIKGEKWSMPNWIHVHPYRPTLEYDS